MPSTLLKSSSSSSMHKAILGHRKLLDLAVMLCKDHNRKRTRRTGHELELIIPASTLEVVTSSSLNIAKKIWNNLPADVATISDPIRFKNAVKGHAVYNLLTNTKIVGRPELRI
jgi:hypothetical protein